MTERQVRSWLGGALFASLMFGLLVTPFTTRAGFGVSPPRILEDNLVPGATLTRTIYLVQGDPDVPVRIRATVDAKETKDWFSFEQGDEFTIPEGVQQFPMDVTITVPQDAELGKYRAFVRVNTVPDPESESGTVAVALGGRIDVDITVGNDVVEEYDIRTIDIIDIYEREDFQVSMRVNNTGNVPVGPDAATFELFDKFGNTRLAFVSVESDAFPEVEPFSEEDVTVEFPVDLIVAPGEYWGHVKVFDEDGRVRKDLRTVFDVFEGTRSGGSTASMGVGNLTGGQTLIGVVVLVLIIIIAFALIRRRKTPVPTKQEQV